VFRFLLFYLRSAGGTDLGKEVGAEDADGEDRNREGDDQVDEGRENLADLQVDAGNRNLELRDTLAGSRGGREEGRDNTLGEGGEELGDDRAEVDGRGDDDNVLGIEHLFVAAEKKRI
jgi:hypothetical protein